jgi:hypothetical protein
MVYEAVGDVGKPVKEDGGEMPDVRKKRDETQRY